MGQILPFKRRTDDAKPVVDRDGRGAEILFFTGVRYEAYIEPRGFDESASKRTRAGKAAGRKRRA